MWPDARRQRRGESSGARPDVGDPAARCEIEPRCHLVVDTSPRRIRPGQLIGHRRPVEPVVAVAAVVAAGVVAVAGPGARRESATAPDGGKPVIVVWLGVRSGEAVPT